MLSGGWVPLLFAYRRGIDTSRGEWPFSVDCLAFRTKSAPIFEAQFGNQE